ncbi:MAG: response regulator [Deltaproteobacteria bacterium]|nr:response regulator [Deltaproteobacteria bacterium]
MVARSNSHDDRNPSPKGIVLFVDDDEMLVFSQKRFLTRMGYTVMAVNSGRAAIEFVEIHGAEILVVLLDLVMPEMGGEEVFHALRSILPDVDIIICSAYSREGTVRRLLDSGARSFVQKPYEPTELVEIIEGLSGLA